MKKVFLFSIISAIVCCWWAAITLYPIMGWIAMLLAAGVTLLFISKK